jgi:hypothetical protein
MEFHTALQRFASFLLLSPRGAYLYHHSTTLFFWTTRNLQGAWFRRYKQAIGKLKVYATLNVSAATTGVGPLHCIIDEVSEKNHTRDIEFHLRGLEVD